MVNLGLLHQAFDWSRMPRGHNKGLCYTNTALKVLLNNGYAKRNFWLALLNKCISFSKYTILKYQKFLHIYNYVQKLRQTLSNCHCFWPPWVGRQCQVERGKSIYIRYKNIHWRWVGIHLTVPSLPTMQFLDLSKLCLCTELWRIASLPNKLISFGTCLSCLLYLLCILESLNPPNYTLPFPSSWLF